MIKQFLIVLFSTFLITRTTAHLLHDMKNYGTKKERSKTITGLLRRKTGFDWHHFHLGILILIITIALILIIGFNNLSIIFLAIGISMTIDQAVPIVNRKTNYFHTKNLIISLIFHIIISLIALTIYFS